jgi:M6 family metalloprotease-like protein
MYTYFWENSYGKMKILPGPLEGVYPPNGWIRMPREMRYYGANENEVIDVHVKEFCVDALREADARIDFTPYDRDNDGKIDHVMVVHAGNDEATSMNPNDLWSRLAGEWILGDNIFCDGKKVTSVICVAEYPDSDRISLGTYCHEFAHDLGAPDLYHIIRSPVGQWCLMGRGHALVDPPSHICGVLKYDLDGREENGIHGWLTPITLPEGRNTYSIAALAGNSGPRLYRVKIGSRSHPTLGIVSEYFYFENRGNQTGTLYDSFENPGLIIWHVDYGGSNILGDPFFAWVEDPTDPQHTQGAITELKNAAYHASTDPQKNFTAFTAETTPNSHRNDGRPSGVSITNISSAGPTMTFTFEFRNLSLERIVREKKISVSPYPNPFNPECYLPVGRMENGGGRMKVKIYNILGQLVREIKISSLNSQVSEFVYWDGRDTRGLEVPSGMYFYEVDGKKVKRMVVLK